MKKKTKSAVKRATKTARSAGSESGGALGSTVPFHAAKLGGRRETLKDGIIYTLSEKRRVEVWSVEGGVAIRIFRPTTDGKTSKLLFGLNDDAACALAIALNRKLQLSNEKLSDR